MTAKLGADENAATEMARLISADDESDLMAAAVAVVGVGVAVFEAALLPGVVPGTAANARAQVVTEYWWRALAAREVDGVRCLSLGSEDQGDGRRGARAREDLVAEVHAEDEATATAPDATKPPHTV